MQYDKIFGNKNLQVNTVCSVINVHKIYNMSAIIPE